MVIFETVRDKVDIEVVGTEGFQGEQRLICFVHGRLHGFFGSVEVRLSRGVLAAFLDDLDAYAEGRASGARIEMEEPDSAGIEIGKTPEGRGTVALFRLGCPGPAARSATVSELVGRTEVRLQELEALRERLTELSRRFGEH